jgi:hypothetical protein
MQTTYQRLKPEGDQWQAKHDRGSLKGNPSNLLVMSLLLDRAVSLYWANRPDVRNCQTQEIGLPA